MSAESKHISSPPWEYIGPYVRDADSLEVCRLPLWRETRAGEGRVLAAAPDLLEACEAALIALFEAGPERTFDPNEDRAAGLLMAAVRKAGCA